MSEIVNTVEIDRPADDVFAYLDAVERHTEWQDQLVSARKLDEGPTRVGTRVLETRRLAGHEEQTTYEITEHDPPRAFGFRGIEGPIRPVGRGLVEPLGDGSRSRLTLTLDFEASGMGKLMLPVVRTAARHQILEDTQKLKARLEQPAA
jgi:uncharacterized membrane protein